MTDKVLGGGSGTLRCVKPARLGQTPSASGPEYLGYHQAMRTWLLALMILLLPLRGWLGDAMALGSATVSLPSVQSTSFLIADNHYSAPTSASFGTESHPCHELSGPSGKSPADRSTEHGACDTCTACQLCHGSAAPPVPWQVPTHALPHPQPQTRLLGFVSAEPRRNDRPPTHPA